MERQTMEKTSDKIKFTKCKICEGPIVTLSIKTVDGLPMAQCQNCGLIFIKEIPSKTMVSSQNEAETINYYSELYSHTPPKFSNGLKMIINYLREKGIKDFNSLELLDIGCGDGTFLQLCKEKGFKVAGVDINQAAVNLCKTKGISEVIHGRIDEVPGDFDIITMFDVMEHLVDPQNLLMRVWKKLKPGGIIYIETPRKCLLDAYISFFSLFTSIRNNRVSNEHLQLFMVKALHILLKISGFNIVYFFKHKSLSWANKKQYIYNLGLRNKTLLSLFTFLANIFISLNLLGRNKVIILAVKRRKI